MKTKLTTNMQSPRLSLRQTLSSTALSLALAFAVAAEAAEGDALATKLRLALTARAEMMANNSEATATAFTLATQNAAEAFSVIELKESGSTEGFVKVVLNKRGTKFDGIRFTVPKGAARDLAWAFAYAPQDRPDFWYILPRAGEMNGFSKFFRPSSGIKGAPWKDANETYAVFAQPLGGGQLKPDKEYLIWFTFQSVLPKNLYVMIKLVPVGTDINSSAAIHTALGLSYDK